jgi:hypothetical protein
MIGFLKQFRRVATRYDKTSASFLCFVQIAAIHRWMRFVHTAASLRCGAQVGQIHRSRRSFGTSGYHNHCPKQVHYGVIERGGPLITKRPEEIGPASINAMGEEVSEWSAVTEIRRYPLKLAFQVPLETCLKSLNEVSGFPRAFILM